MGRSLGANLPEDISVVTVESQKVYEFSEEMTPAVAAAVPQALKIIQDLLIESNPENASQINEYEKLRRNTDGFTRVIATLSILRFVV